MRKLFLVLIALGVLVIVAAGVFVLYAYPEFVKPKQEYQSALSLFDSGDYVPAALQFESMKDNPRAQELAVDAWLKAGDKSFEEGDLAQARTYYLKGGASSEVLSKLDSAYYQLGVQAYADNLRVEAENCFSCISSGSSYLKLLDPVRISCAERFLLAGDFDSAQKVFHLCGEGSYGEISRLWLDCGSTRLSSFDIDYASYCFAKSMAYAEDPEARLSEIDALWNEAGLAARQRGDAILAAKCFARTSTGGEQGDNARIEAYDSALSALSEGRSLDALKLFCEASGYEDADARAAELRAQLKNYYSAGRTGCYAMLDSGSVTIGGDWGSYHAPLWTEVEKLAVGGNRFMLGLTRGGTVLFHGNSSFGNAEVGGWISVSDIACGESHSVALTYDGRVLACGPDISGEVSGVSNWSGVTKIAAGSAFTAALLSDGSVLACGDDSAGQCQTFGLSGIASIACGSKHLVCLRSDGTVTAIGANSFGQCEVSAWTGVIEVFAGANHTVGLRADGTLAACGDNTYGQCSVEGIEDVLSVACGSGFTLILLNDGTTLKLGA